MGRFWKKVKELAKKAWESETVREIVGERLAPKEKNDPFS